MLLQPAGSVNFATGLSTRCGARHSRRQQQNEQQNPVLVTSSSGPQDSSGLMHLAAAVDDDVDSQLQMFIFQEGRSQGTPTH